ncbi:MAG: DUF2269 family protein [Acidimicrobiales bacterium]
MPAPAYDVLLILHIASAFIGFGSIAIGGWAASAGRRSGDPGGEERVVRFFREGTDWPGRVIFVVPVLGLVLLLGGDHPDIGRAWPWIGLGLWVVAAGLASGLGWPAERRAQVELAALRAGDNGRLESFQEACAQMERACAVITVSFVIVVTLMIWQP